MSDGERDAWFVRSVFVHDAGLRRLLRRLRTHPNDISDICQETYLRALTERRCFQKPRAYLFEVARNLLIDLRRKTSPLIADLERDPEFGELLRCDVDPERRATADSELARFNAAVAALPTRCRQVYWLKHVHRLSGKQVARQLGMTPHTVEQHISKALRSLRERGVAIAPRCRR